MVRFLIACACVLFAVPAAAEWHVAESRHFVVYADDEREDVERFVGLLERYASAISVATEMDVPIPSPSNRLTIFMVGNKSDIRRLNGSGSRFVTGFYVPRAAGSVAFVPEMEFGRRGYPLPLIVLLHEYAHHHIALGTRETMPMWLREGFAEYLASTRFLPDKSVELGHQASHRWPELFKMENARVRELLVEEGRDLTARGSYEGYYGKAWLLYHYFSSSPERQAHLDAYRSAIAAGTSPAEAARAAFGEYGNLDYLLSTHMRNWDNEPIKIAAEDLETGEVTIAEVDEASVAALPVYMQLRRGVTSEEKAGLAAEAAQVAARFPASAFVQAVLAQAAFEAGDDAAAVAAAERALAIDPQSKEALLYKGYAQFRQAPEANDPDAAYAAAMASFTALNTLENDHPVPLVQLYRSYVDRGLEPTVQAKLALERAAELAPQDKYLWLTVGVMQARDGRIAQARESLLPIATDFHDEQAASTARAMLARLDQVETSSAED